MSRVNSVILREALREWDEGVWPEYNEASEIAEAAREWLAGTEYKWCRTHGDWSRLDFAPLCRWAHHVLGTHPKQPCDIVPARLVGLEEAVR